MHKKKCALSEAFSSLVCDCHSGDGSRRSIGELSSSLGASSLKNFSAVSGCHSLSEAVFLFSLSFLRLICSLHDSTSFNLFNVKKRALRVVPLRIHTKAEYIITEKVSFVNTFRKYFFHISFFVYLLLIIFIINIDFSIYIC